MNKAIIALVLMVMVLATACTVGEAQRTEFFCSDSDNTKGLTNPMDSYYVKGYSDSNFGPGEDVCKESILVEYYCDGKVRKRMSYDCNFGCFEGACMREFSER